MLQEESRQGRHKQDPKGQQRTTEPLRPFLTDLIVEFYVSDVFLFYLNISFVKVKFFIELRLFGWGQEPLKNEHKL